jgi:enterobactin synthetase component D
MSFHELFRLNAADGLIVAMSLPSYESGVKMTCRERLMPKECAYMETLEPRRQITFAGGRLALRAALTALGGEVHTSLPNPRGAPNLPAGYRGSISHKDHVAIAWVTPDTGWYVGVDVEVAEPNRSRIASKVLTSDELLRVESLPEAERWPRILRHFSLKEAIYKAIDPMVERYVGFKEVAVLLGQGMDAKAELRLNSSESLEVHCGWREYEGFVLSTARARATRPV